MHTTARPPPYVRISDMHPGSITPLLSAPRQEFVLNLLTIYIQKRLLVNYFRFVDMLTASTKINL